MSSFNDELLTFLSKSPTPFHAVKNMSAQLEKGALKNLMKVSVGKLLNLVAIML